MIRLFHPPTCDEQYDWVHLFESFLKITTPSSRVLEIGSSVPEKTINLSVHCRELVGIDKFSSRLFKFNQKNIRPVRCSWEDLDLKFPKNYFDIAIASHVIEHVADDVGNLNRLYNVLKVGGTALLTTPNRRRLTRSIIEIFTGPRAFPWWEHLREYDHQDVIDLVGKTKFKKFVITPVVFGIHADPYQFYLKKVPPIFTKYANYWEIKLIK